jgi:hypothetical protein
MNRCPYCFRTLELLRVHGHDQCRHCGVNVYPCCNGEQCEPLGVEEEQSPHNRQPDTTPPKS